MENEDGREQISAAGTSRSSQHVCGAASVRPAVAQSCEQNNVSERSAGQPRCSEPSRWAKEPRSLNREVGVWFVLERFLTRLRAASLSHRPGDLAPPTAASLHPVARGVR